MTTVAGGVDFGKVSAELVEDKVRVRFGDRERLLPIVRRRTGFVAGLRLAPWTRPIAVDRPVC